MDEQGELDNDLSQNHASLIHQPVRISLQQMSSGTWLVSTDAAVTTGEPSLTMVTRFHKLKHGQDRNLDESNTS